MQNKRLGTEVLSGIRSRACAYRPSVADLQDSDQIFAETVAFVAKCLLGFPVLLGLMWLAAYVGA